MMLELELAPVIGTKSDRLPWCRRASPSTTRHESVTSTDADKMILNAKGVNCYFSTEDRGQSYEVARFFLSPQTGADQGLSRLRHRAHCAGRRTGPGMLWASSVKPARFSAGSVGVN